MIYAFLLLIQAVSATQVANVQQDAPLARAQFDAQLLDYPTARFRDVHITINPVAEAERGQPGRGYLCGYVNSKNRMGGYSGWRRFMVVSEFLTIEGDRPDIVIDGACGSGGVSDGIDRTSWVQYR